MIHVPRSRFSGGEIAPFLAQMTAALVPMMKSEYIETTLHENVGAVWFLKSGCPYFFSFQDSSPLPSTTFSC